ncbi:hypothetical protein BJX68DRAFT_56481 [Aspergillus pseudodeflectus]|uniref:Secreted protein n=1 Tax=Aspergillus pseudodeflectus TaxID=176178 RepID=A0ABR4KK59_9EURO
MVFGLLHIMSWSSCKASVHLEVWMFSFLQRLSMIGRCVCQSQLPNKFSFTLFLFVHFLFSYSLSIFCEINGILPCSSFELNPTTGVTSSSIWELVNHKLASRGIAQSPVSIKWILDANLCARERHKFYVSPASAISPTATLITLRISSWTVPVLRALRHAKNV